MIKKNNDFDYYVYILVNKKSLKFFCFLFDKSFILFFIILSLSLVCFFLYMSLCLFFCPFFSLYVFLATDYCFHLFLFFFFFFSHIHNPLTLLFSSSPFCFHSSPIFTFSVSTSSFFISHPLHFFCSPTDFLILFLFLFSFSLSLIYFTLLRSIFL